MSVTDSKYDLFTTCYTREKKGTWRHQGTNEMFFEVRNCVTLKARYHGALPWLGSMFLRFFHNRSSTLSKIVDLQTGQEVQNSYAPLICCDKSKSSSF